MCYTYTSNHVTACKSPHKICPLRVPRIQACGSSKDEVAAMMLKVGFSKKMMNDPVTTLSGGWRMTLALARAKYVHDPTV